MPGLQELLVVPLMADLNSVVALAYLYARTPPSHNLAINPTRNPLKTMQYRDDPLEAEAVDRRDPGKSPGIGS